MNKHEILEPKEFDTVKECLKNPFFYLSLIIVIAWGHLSSPWMAALTVPFAISLCLLTFVDMKHMILPDIITIPMIFIGLLLHFFLTGNLLIPVMGAAIGFTIFFLVFYISYKIKGVPGMGFGDVKLLAMLGAWVGISGLPLILIYASIFSLSFILIKTIYKRSFSNNPFPYGPFLCLGGWLTFLYHDETWAVILDLRQQLINSIIG